MKRREWRRGSAQVEKSGGAGSVPVENYYSCRLAWRLGVKPIFSGKQPRPKLKTQNSQLSMLALPFLPVETAIGGGGQILGSRRVAGLELGRPQGDPHRQVRKAGGQLLFHFPA